VEIFHRLSGIKDRLEKLKCDFETVDRYDGKALHRLRDETFEIKGAYKATLVYCSDQLNGKNAFKHKNSDFQDMLHIFLKRTATNDHTILPYMNSFTWYFIEIDSSTRGGNSKQIACKQLGSNATDKDIWNLTLRRLDEAIYICEGYLCLLASTMDRAVKSFNVGEEIRKIIDTQRLVSMLKCHDSIEDKFQTGDYLYRLEAEHKNIRVIDNYGGDITNFKPIFDLLTTFTVTNAIKATFIASYCQRYGERGNNFVTYGRGGFGEAVLPINSDKYANLPVISEPRITVTINDRLKDVSVIFEDNGIGVSNQDIYNMYTRNSNFAVFGKFTASTGSCMPLVPHMMNFMGSTLHAKGEIGKGASFEYIFPKIRSWQ